MTKFKVPELPRYDDFHKPFMLHKFHPNGNPFIDGCVYVTDNVAFKHSEAAVLAIEALEKLGDTETLEKIKKIYEQRGE